MLSASLYHEGHEVYEEEGKRGFRAKALDKPAKAMNRLFLLIQAAGVS